MYAVRFGSYSIDATFAGTLSLVRLKSILRYRRLAPPPRWRAVLRPSALRPPDFLTRPSTSERSGSVLVISAKSGYVTNRRPGEVGFGLRTGMAYRSASRPWKIGMVSPSRTWTTAFFQDRVRP